MKILDFAIRIIDGALSFIYPNRCVGCGEIISEKETLCEFCAKDIKYYDAKKRCIACGLDKDNCQCKESVFYFDGAICVFYNEGAAQNAVYSYKLKRRPGNFLFIADAMSKTVEREFANIKFDAVIPVPAARKSRLKYGFSPVLELAYTISDNLKIKLDKSLLKAKSGSPQHKQKYNERFQNIKGRYFTCKNKNYKTVLLVDDIKTSGATLSECARQLKFAGVDRVYCVTALAGVKKSDKKK